MSLLKVTPRRNYEYTELINKKLHIFPEWYKRSFAFKGSQEWNLLHRELRETGSTLVFKNLLRKFHKHGHIW